MVQLLGKWIKLPQGSSDLLLHLRFKPFFIHSSITLLIRICKHEPPGERTYKARHLFSMVLSCFSLHHTAVDTNKDI